MNFGDPQRQPGDSTEAQEPEPQGIANPYAEGTPEWLLYAIFGESPT